MTDPGRYWSAKIKVKNLLMPDKNILGFKLKQKLEKAEKFCSEPLFTPHRELTQETTVCTIYMLETWISGIEHDSGTERIPQILTFVLQILQYIYLNLLERRINMIVKMAAVLAIRANEVHRSCRSS